MLRGSRASCQPCTCHAGWRLDCSWSAPRFDARGRVAASRPGDAGGGVAIGGRHLGLRPPGEGICSHRNAPAQGGGRVGCREMPVQGPHGWTECSRARRAGVRACGNRLGPGRATRATLAKANACLPAMGAAGKGPVSSPRSPAHNAPLAMFQGRPARSPRSLAPPGIGTMRWFASWLWWTSAASGSQSRRLWPPNACWWKRFRSLERSTASVIACSHLPISPIISRDLECCSASPFDPPESKRINVLPRRSASNLHA